MPDGTKSPIPLPTASEAASLAMGQTEMAGAAALSAVMANAAAAQAACQQIELSAVAVLVAQIVKKAAG